MKGLELKQSYWQEVASPALQRGFPTLFSRIAVGTLGHGSEYLGLDDELSRDHDWGSGFTVFLTDDDFSDIGAEVFNTLLALPQEHHGYKPFWGRLLGKGETVLGRFWNG